MDIKKALKGMKEEAQCQLWRLEDVLKESWDNLKSSGKAKSAAAMGIPIAGLAFAYWLAPKPVYGEEARQFLCGLPENTSADLRNKVLELMKEGWMLNVKAGETIAQAIAGKALSYSDSVQRKTFIDEETMFLTQLGYNINRVYSQPCSVPRCTSLDGCNSLELIAGARGENAPTSPAPIVTSEASLASPEAGLHAPPPPAILQMYNQKDFIQFLWEARAGGKKHDYINENFVRYNVMMSECTYETRLGIGAAGAKRRKMDIFYVGKGYADSGTRVAVVRYDENGGIVDINEVGILDGNGAGRDAGKITPFLVSDWSVERGQGMVNIESISKSLIWLYLTEEGARTAADPNAPTIYNGYRKNGGGNNPQPEPPTEQTPPPVPLPGNP